MHCRVAGLRTANACVKLLDAAQMASKLVPQASILLLDKSAEVRSLAFTLIESCLEALRVHHQAMIAAAKSESGGRAGSSSSTSTPSKQQSGDSASLSAPSSAARSGSGGEEAVGSSWSSWSVLQGLSKSIESATIVSPDNQAHSQTPVSSGIADASTVKAHLSSAADAGGRKLQPGPGLKPSASVASNGSDSMMLRSGGFGDDNNYGNDDDLDFDPDMHDGLEVDDHSSTTSSSKNVKDSSKAPDRTLGGKKNSGQGRQGWGDPTDDLDLDEEEEEDVGRLAPKLAGVSLGGRIGGLGVGGNKPSPAAPRGMSLKPADNSGGKAAKVPKVAVTKLSVDKGEDNWDDF